MAGFFEIADLPKSLIRYGVGLWRKRWTVAIVTWLTALAAWFGLWLIPDKYESRSQVYVQTETVLDPVMSGVTARPNYEKRVEVMRLQLLSGPNVEEIIRRAGLDKEVTASNPRERRAQMQKLVEWVSGQISIASPQEMYFVIQYKNSDPLIARNVVDAATNMLIEQDLGASLSENEAARKRLDDEITAFDDRLTAKEQEVAVFRQQHAEELALVQGNDRRRDLLEADLSRVADDIARAERQVATVRSLLSSTNPTGATGELDKLLVELAALRSQYQEDYPDIQALKARIEKLQSGSGNQLPTNPEYKRLLGELRVAQDSVAALKSRETRIRADLDALSFTFGQVPAVLAELKRIERDYEQSRKNYEELIERRDRLMITNNLGAGRQGVEYKVYEQPQVSLIPSAPPRLILIAAATLGALGAGIGAGVLLTWMQKSFTQAVELQTAFGLPVLGALSEVRSADVMAGRRRDLRRLGIAGLALLALAGFYIYWEVYRLPSAPIDGVTTASLAERTAESSNDSR